MVEKNEIKPKNPPKTPIVGLENFKKAEILAIKRPGGPLKLKMWKMVDVQAISGVLRDILTKFQKILSTNIG